MRGIDGPTVRLTIWHLFLALAIFVWLMRAV